MTRQLRWGLLAVSSIFAGGAPTSASAAEIVLFNPADFSELGSIETGPAIAQIQVTRRQIEIVPPTISQSFFDEAVSLITTNLPIVGDFFEAAESARAAAEAANAETIGEIAGAFGSIELDSLTRSVSEARQLAADISDDLAAADIRAPTLGLYVASAVSPTARNEISSGLAEFRSLNADLAGSQADVQRLALQMDRLSANASNAARAADELFEVFVQTPVPFAQTKAIELLADATALRDLSNRASSAAAELRALNPGLGAAIQSINDNINSYTFALSYPLAESTWQASASFVGQDSSFFSLAFTPRTYVLPGAEGIGNFMVGELAVSNFITPTTGSPIFNGTMTFNLTQTVNFMGKSATYSGSVSSPFEYVPTTNTNDPRASADGFYVQLLGLSYGVLESTTATFGVNGRVNSPFLLTSLTPLDANGFQSGDAVHYPDGIVPSVPEPGTWAMMLLGFGAVGHAMRRRATFATHLA